MSEQSEAPRTEPGLPNEQKYVSADDYIARLERELSEVTEKVEGWEQAWRLAEEHGQHQKARAIAAERELEALREAKEEEIRYLESKLKHVEADRDYWHGKLTGITAALTPPEK